MVEALGCMQDSQARRGGTGEGAGPAYSSLGWSLVWSCKRELSRTNLCPVHRPGCLQPPPLPAPLPPGNATEPQGKAHGRLLDALCNLLRAPLGMPFAHPFAHFFHSGTSLTANRWRSGAARVPLPGCPHQSQYSPPIPQERKRDV